MRTKTAGGATDLERRGIDGQGRLAYTTPMRCQQPLHQTVVFVITDVHLKWWTTRAGEA